MECDYLLLDEAFDGLDPLVVESIKGEIISASLQGKTIVISSHNIRALERLADRFLILSKGSLAKESDNEDLGVEFVKFQASFPVATTEENIAALGYEVISFKMVGSVCHFVLLDQEGQEEKIREALSPVFIEKIPLEPDEIISLEMLIAKQGGEKHE